MKTLRICFVLAAILGCETATRFANAVEEKPARSPLEGIWKWTFKMPDGGEVNPRVKFKTDKNHELTGTARFRQGLDAPVTNIVLNGDNVSFDVVRVRDGKTTTTHYAGKLTGDKIKGKITSDWSGEAQTYDWRAEKSNDLDGAWKWEVTFGERSFDMSMTLKRDGDKVSGKLHLGRGGEPDIHHGRFRNSELSFEVHRERDGERSTNFYRGKLSGDSITGSYTSNFGRRRTNDWHATRAD